MTAADHRLPVHVVPERYRIEMAPDIERASFDGSVSIRVRIAERTDEIVCNAAELEIRSAEIRQEGRAGAYGSTRRLDHRIDDERERLHLSAPGGFAAGTAELRLSFAGVLNDRLCGFYRSVYADDDGSEHVIATTQFQSTDARRAFPCWDEPAFKAVFETALICDPDLLAVSNTAEITAEILDDGRRRTSFAPTMPMSTYLVAFVVGRLEASEPTVIDGVPIRVIHRPGQGRLAGYARQTARFALHWLAEYYDIAYPSDKVDLIAVPDFAFGAMENLGCVTFRETLLLVDPATASRAELQRVTDVINHELAHMWFGDLVTMKWWEGIWLNEAFATFMEISCTDAYKPQWRAWETFARARSEAMSVDALAATRPIEYPVLFPADAEAMYDLLTYEKGAAVVKMLERHLGAEAFRDGVRHYLRSHQYSNTATSDLWDALESTTGRPVRAMMDDWILVGGHPLVEAEPTPHGLRLRQSRFTLDPAPPADMDTARLWSVPLAIAGDDGSVQRLLLDQRAVHLTGASGAVRSLNEGGFGFFRSLMHGDGGRRDGFAGLDAAGLHSLVDDEWALTLSGRRSAAEFTSLIEGVASRPAANGSGAAGDDLNVWQAIAAALGELMRLVAPHEAAAAALQARVAAMCGPALDRIGAEPSDDDDDRTLELRAVLVRLLGALADDPQTIAACAARFEAAAAASADPASGAAPAEPSLAAADLAVFARHADAEGFELLRDRWLHPADPVAEQRHLRAMAGVSSVELVERLLADIADGTVRTQDAPYVLAMALGNRSVGRRVWDFVENRWDDLNERFPSNSIPRMLEGVVALDSAEDCERVSRFLAEHPLAQAGLRTAQVLERQRVNAALRDREFARYSAWLTGGGSASEPADSDSVPGS